MPPAPARWKGVCQEGESFNSTNCNRKLIGARFYAKGHRASPRDARGHGTHTSSTAAGAVVQGANIFRYGAGTAQGMAPEAHIAVYKVCWFNGCYSSDILAGIDDAVRDGVDVLSLSLGGFPLPLFEDSIAIGSFRAIERGVTVVCAGGNNGPIPGTVANEAPWITTVGASTLDRRFPAAVRLNRGADLCLRGSLSRDRVAGKMVVCDRGVNGRAEKGEAVMMAGGAAMVLANTEINQEEDSVDVHVLPATLIGYKESIELKSYINSTKSPKARLIFAGTSIGKSRAPAVALFSSRGPSLTVPSVLKPDVIAPGVNIIAAWPGNLGPSSLPEDRRRSNFSVLSGTSMACPHVSGIAALVRAAHRTWSPAAVRSAIMTTADTFDHYGKPIMDGQSPAGVFVMGAGHINPTRAIDPGLVYDISPEDYVVHLCSLHYTKAEMSLNYPSISVEFKKGREAMLVRRTMTNVGAANSTYSATVSAPPGVSVRVVPEILSFGRIGERRSYRVWFVLRKETKGKKGNSEGQISWVSCLKKCYRVRSPLSVTWEA
ncbi:Subtilisin-like protease SDD1 [Apostasia shenzhenica]|uniref:Subtilisin-like protease SDD1 n=1 Tax=Apostasia shenzhenica TaxID=1088818 RepID=A0A2I0BF79_9ASPA|nr:Subtilisin-like protease SDD1 [Apostasia shenzhenica]